MTANTERRVTCPSCQTVNQPFEAFCHKCGVPIGTTATLDPLKVIRAEGHLFRRALEGRPKLVVLIGVWILFFPVLVGSAFSAVNLIVNHRSRSDFVFIWFAVGLAYLSVVVLYRVTRNYLTIRRNGKIRKRKARSS